MVDLFTSETLRLPESGRVALLVALVVSLVLPAERVGWKIAAASVRLWEVLKSFLKIVYIWHHSSSPLARLCLRLFAERVRNKNKAVLRSDLQRFKGKLYLFEFFFSYLG